MTQQRYLRAADRSRIDAANDDEIRWWPTNLALRVSPCSTRWKSPTLVADVRRHLDEALARARPSPSVIA